MQETKQFFYYIGLYEQNQTSVRLIFNLTQENQENAYQTFTHLDTLFDEGMLYSATPKPDQLAFLLGRHRLCPAIDYTTLGYLLCQANKPHRQLQVPDSIELRFQFPIKKEDGSCTYAENSPTVCLKFSNLRQELLNVYQKLDPIEASIFECGTFDNLGNYYLDLSKKENKENFLNNIDSFKQFFLSYPNMPVYVAYPKSEEQKTKINQNISLLIKNNKLTNFIEKYESDQFIRTATGDPTDLRYHTFSEIMSALYEQKNAKLNTPFGTATIVLAKNESTLEDDRASGKTKFNHITQNKDFLNFLTNNPNLRLTIDLSDIQAQDQNQQILKIQNEIQKYLTCPITYRAQNQVIERQPTIPNQRTLLYQKMLLKCADIHFQSSTDENKQRLFVRIYLGSAAQNRNVELAQNQNQNQNQNRNLNVQIPEVKKTEPKPEPTIPPARIKIPDDPFFQFGHMSQIFGFTGNNQPVVDATLLTYFERMSAMRNNKRFYLPFGFSVSEPIPGAMLGCGPVSVDSVVTKERNFILFSPQYAPIARQKDPYSFVLYERKRNQKQYGPLQLSNLLNALQHKIDQDDATGFYTELLSQAAPDQKEHIQKLFSGLMMEHGPEAVLCVLKYLGDLKRTQLAIYESLVRDVLPSSQDLSELLDQNGSFFSGFSSWNETQAQWWKELIAIQISVNPEFNILDLKNVFLKFWADMARDFPYMSYPMHFPLTHFTDAAVALGKIKYVMSHTRNPWAQIQEKNWSIDAAYCITHCFHGSFYCPEMDHAIQMAFEDASMPWDALWKDPNHKMDAHFHEEKFLTRWDSVSQKDPIDFAEERAYLLCFASVIGNAPHNARYDANFYRSIFQKIDTLSEQMSAQQKVKLYYAVSFFVAQGNNRQEYDVFENITQFATGNATQIEARCDFLLKNYKNINFSYFQEPDQSGLRFRHKDFFSFETARFLACASFSDDQKKNVLNRMHKVIEQLKGKSDVVQKAVCFLCVQNNSDLIEDFNQKCQKLLNNGLKDTHNESNEPKVLLKLLLPGLMARTVTTIKLKKCDKLLKILMDIHIKNSLFVHTDHITELLEQAKNSEECPKDLLMNLITAGLLFHTLTVDDRTLENQINQIDKTNPDEFNALRALSKQLFAQKITKKFPHLVLTQVQDLLEAIYPQAQIDHFDACERVLHCVWNNSTDVDSARNFLDILSGFGSSSAPQWPLYGVFFQNLCDMHQNQSEAFSRIHQCDLLRLFNQKLLSIQDLKQQENMQTIFLSIQNALGKTFVSSHKRLPQYILGNKNFCTALLSEQFSWTGIPRNDKAISEKIDRLFVGGKREQALKVFTRLVQGSKHMQDFYDALCVIVAFTEKYNKLKEQPESPSHFMRNFDSIAQLDTQIIVCLNQWVPLTQPALIFFVTALCRNELDLIQKNGSQFNFQTFCTQMNQLKSYIEDAACLDLLTQFYDAKKQLMCPSLTHFTQCVTYYRKKLLTQDPNQEIGALRLQIVKNAIRRCERDPYESYDEQQQLQSGMPHQNFLNAHKPEKSLYAQKQKEFFDTQQVDRVIHEIVKPFFKDQPEKALLMNQMLHSDFGYFNSLGYECPLAVDNNRFVLIRQLDTQGLKNALAAQKEKIQKIRKLPNFSAHSIEYRKQICELLAVLREAMRRFSGKLAYSTQMIVVLLAVLSEDQPVMAQINTGEGKALISTLMLAAQASIRPDWHWVNTTSNTELSQRDSETYEQFIQWCDFTHHYVTSEVKNATQTRTSHATLHEFLLSHAGRPVSPEKCGIIVDEGDEGLANPIAAINSVSEGDPKDYWLYQDIWSYVAQNFLEGSKPDVSKSKKQQIQNCFQFLRHKITERQQAVQSQYAKALQRLELNEEDSPEKKEQEKIQLNATYTANLEEIKHQESFLEKKDFSDRIDALLDAAIVATQMKDGSHFTVVLYQNDSQSVTVRVVPVSDGKPIVEGDVLYTNGVHQFLIAQLMHQTATARAHFLNKHEDLQIGERTIQFLKPAELKPSSYYNNYVLSALAGNFVAITGTVPQSMYQIAQALMPVGQNFVIPPHRENKRKDEIKNWTQVCTTNQQYVFQDEEALSQRIIAIINQHAQEGDGQSQPVLIYCKDQNACNAYQDKLKQKGIQAEHIQIIDGAGKNFTHGEYPTEEGQKACQNGMITLTVGDGRGIDLKPENKEKGLLSICTFAPQCPETILQIFGRAGRNGMPGSSALVILERDLERYGQKFQDLDALYRFEDVLRTKKFNFENKKIGYALYHIQSFLNDEQIKKTFLSEAIRSYELRLLEAVVQLKNANQKSRVTVDHTTYEIDSWDPFAMLVEQDLEKIFEQWLIEANHILSRIGAKKEWTQNEIFASVQKIEQKRADAQKKHDAHFKYALPDKWRHSLQDQTLTVSEDQAWMSKVLKTFTKKMSLKLAPFAHCDVHQKYHALLKHEDLQQNLKNPAAVLQFFNQQSALLSAHCANLSDAALYYEDAESRMAHIQTMKTGIQEEMEKMHQALLLDEAVRYLRSLCSQSCKNTQWIQNIGPSVRCTFHMERIIQDAPKDSVLVFMARFVHRCGVSQPNEKDRTIWQAICTWFESSPLKPEHTVSFAQTINPCSGKNGLKSDCIELKELVKQILNPKKDLNASLDWNTAIQNLKLQDQLQTGTKQIDVLLLTCEQKLKTESNRKEHASPAFLKFFEKQDAVSKEFLPLAKTALRELHEKLIHLRDFPLAQNEIHEEHKQKITDFLNSFDKKSTPEAIKSAFADLRLCFTLNKSECDAYRKNSKDSYELWFGLKNQVDSWYFNVCEKLEPSKDNAVPHAAAELNLELHQPEPVVHDSTSISLELSSKAQCDALNHKINHFLIIQLQALHNLTHNKRNEDSAIDQKYLIVRRYFYSGKDTCPDFKPLIKTRAEKLNILHMGLLMAQRNKNIQKKLNILQNAFSLIQDLRVSYSFLDRVRSIFSAPKDRITCFARSFCGQYDALSTSLEIPHQEVNNARM